MFPRGGGEAENEVSQIQEIPNGDGETAPSSSQNGRKLQSFNLKPINRLIEVDINIFYQMFLQV